MRLKNDTSNEHDYQFFINSNRTDSVYVMFFLRIGWNELGLIDLFFWIKAKKAHKMQLIEHDAGMMCGVQC